MSDMEISRDDNCSAGATTAVGMPMSQNAQIRMTLPAKMLLGGPRNQLPGGALTPEPFETGAAAEDADVGITLGWASDA